MKDVIVTAASNLINAIFSAIFNVKYGNMNHKKQRRRYCYEQSKSYPR